MTILPQFLKNTEQTSSEDGLDGEWLCGWPVVTDAPRSAGLGSPEPMFRTLREQGEETKEESGAGGPGSPRPPGRPHQAEPLRQESWGQAALYSCIRPPPVSVNFSLLICHRALIMPPSRGVPPAGLRSRTNVWPTLCLERRPVLTGPAALRGRDEEHSSGLKNDWPSNHDLQFL